MLRTFRYPLKPNKAQEATFIRWLAACQQLYNGALQHRRDAWHRQRVNIGVYTQFAELTELRTHDDDWKAIPVEVARSALRRVDLAFKAFFRRVKAGEKPGYPRFRSRDRYNSFGVSGKFAVEGDRVRLPKLGFVKFKLYRPLRGKILDVRVRRDGESWYVCFACDLGAAPPKVVVRTAVGVDVGLKVFVTLSDGSPPVENPRFFRVGQALLTRRQQALARKHRGSNSRQRARHLVARAHLHVRNQRLDFARKLACALVTKYDLIAHEDLAISRMVHGTFAKSIYDAAWGLFIEALTCKAESAGKWAIPVDPRGTTQRCSRCGRTVPKTLADRTHSCECGLVLDRDLNASINILALGRSAAQSAEESQ